MDTQLVLSLVVLTLFLPHLWPGPQCNNGSRHLHLTTTPKPHLTLCSRHHLWSYHIVQVKQCHKDRLRALPKVATRDSLVTAYVTGSQHFMWGKVSTIPLFPFAL